jgi:hypothetical protein
MHLPMIHAHDPAYLYQQFDGGSRTTVLGRVLASNLATARPCSIPWFGAYFQERMAVARWRP